MPSIDDPGAAGLLLSIVDMGLVDQRHDEEFDKLIATFKSSEFLKHDEIS
jgi:hypothetical protein